MLPDPSSASCVGTCAFVPVKQVNCVPQTSAARLLRAQRTPPVAAACMLRPPVWKQNTKKKVSEAHELLVCVYAMARPPVLYMLYIYYIYIYSSMRMLDT